MPTLHLMTQRDQPYGSERRCCERCGIMLVWRPPTFWANHAYVEDEQQYYNQATFVTCEEQRRAELAPPTTGATP